jgi:hypothetical protein
MLLCLVGGPVAASYLSCDNDPIKWPLFVIDNCSGFKLS